VLQPMNPNAPSPPPPAPGMAPTSPPPATATNGTVPGSEPRRIKTLMVPPDQANGASAPAGAASSPTQAAVPPPPAKPAPVARATAPAATRNPSAANASANAPLSLSPQAAQGAPAAEPRARVAAVNPAPVAETAPSGAGGGYLVQVSSQRNEADAQASYRALQGKFPAVLGSHTPLIKRVDISGKGVYYRAMVGPFGSSDEASQLCGSLKSAGGQCVVQRN
jgi:SPOR domain